MTKEEALHKLEFMRNAYQKLIDENVDEGRFVGTDVTGTWKADTPLNKVYAEHVEALDMAVSALRKQEQDKWVPCNKKKPDIDSEVFITDSFGEIGHAYYVNLGDRVCFVTAEEYIILEDVKAWKPVPKAYKGD